jgi:hypothetical protein
LDLTIFNHFEIVTDQIFHYNNDYLSIHMAKI